MRYIRSSKLSDWCLRVIVENLKLYMNSESIPRKHIDFLLRVHSDYVYREFSYINTMTEERILWFINPYSKKVILPDLTESIIRKLQYVGQRITSLTLVESLASERMVTSVLCCVPHITYLNLSTSACSDATLLFIKQMCPDVVTLNLRECARVTNRGMELLCGHESIQNLNILNTEVDCEGLYKVLQGIPSLQRIEFNHLADALFQIHEKHGILESDKYKNIKYNLTEFVYRDFFFCNDIIPVVWAWTVLCPNVKKVHLDFPATSAILELCTNFQNLEELKIMSMYGPPFSSRPSARRTLTLIESLTPFFSFTNNLKTLILCCTHVPIVTVLENFKNLEILHLLYVSFSSFSLEDIKIQETKLDTLIIKDTKIEFADASYKAISLLFSLSKNVTKLRLNRIQTLTEEILHIMSTSMKRLTFIDFSYCKIKGSVSCFFKMPSLKIIYCDVCPGFVLHEDPTIRNFVSEHCCTLSWRILDTLSDTVDDYIYNCWDYDRMDDLW